MIRSAALAPLARKLTQLGLPLERRVMAAHIPLEALERTDLVLPEAPLWALLDDVRRRDGIPDIGFQLGASHRVTDVEGFSSVVGGHSTLLKTLRAFCGGMQTHANYWDHWIEPTAEGARICRKGSPLLVGHEPVEHYVICYLVDLVRMAAPPSWWPAKIWLQGSADLTKEELGWLRNAEVRFDQTVTAISVPGAFMVKRPRAEPRDSRRAQAVLDRDFLPALRQMLPTYVTEGVGRLEQVAAALDLHPRTFQRRLAGAGTSFQELLEEARMTLACTQLSSTQASVSDIAYELGYQHLSSFSRSFRQSTGVAPSVYRASNRSAS
jgi:AraC-like DNA-binding protein